MPKSFVRETTTAAVGETAERGVVPITVASPGWGSSGWYSPQVLENAVTGRVFGQGLHLYLDHPGEGERHDRPERSVRDLVGTLTEDATWDPQRGIVAEAKIFGPYRDLFRDEDFVEAVGVSLRAFADTTVGEAEGRKGTIITDLIEAQSVDFVTKAGRGGRVMAALESARTEVHEATTDEVRTALSAAVADHSVDGFVEDFDPDTGTVYVFTFADGADGNPSGDRSRMWAYPYTYTAPNAAIDWSDATEVRRTVTYVPITPNADTGAGSTSVPAPAGQPTATESQGDDMATTQIEETALAALRQDAERVPTLESERDTAVTRAETAEARIAERERADAITAVIESVDGHDTLSNLERRGLAADARNSEDGTLDEAALRTSIETAVAERAEQSGAGRITGFGHTENPQVEESADPAVAAAFGRTVKGA